jgi:muramoyltetrapeptide carboxypeptidase
MGSFMTNRPLVRVQKHSRVRIVAPARSVNRQAIDNCRMALERRGFQVSYGTHVFERYNPCLDLAGDDRSRAADLMEALLSPEVDWVLCADGGYGAMRLLPYLDPDALSHMAPKPVVGFSDVTALHLFLGRLGWWTIHGLMAYAEPWDGRSGDWFIRLMVDGATDLTDVPLQPVANPPTEPLIAPWRGGNLALVTALVGTPYVPDWQGTVLYLEEVHEKPYRIDRMLQQLRLSGVLSELRGIVFGDAVFDGDEDGLDDAVRDLLGEIADDLGIPAWWGLASGHRDPMISIPLGVPLAIHPSGLVRMTEGAMA